MLRRGLWTKWTVAAVALLAAGLLFTLIALAAFMHQGETSVAITNRSAPARLVSCPDCPPDRADVTITVAVDVAGALPGSPIVTTSESTLRLPVRLEVVSVSGDAEQIAEVRSGVAALEQQLGWAGIGMAPLGDDLPTEATPERMALELRRDQLRRDVVPAIKARLSDPLQLEAERAAIAHDVLSTVRLEASLALPGATVEPESPSPMIEQPDGSWLAVWLVSPNEVRMLPGTSIVDWTS